MTVAPTGVAGFRCAVCGALVDIATPLSWRCPNATETDRHHALQIVGGGAAVPVLEDANPFLSFRRALAWDAFAAAAGMTELARVALIAETDAAVAAVAGTGFRWTPFARSDRLSDALGFTATGGVWIKDETANVAGSHKARHLFTILLHLLTAERMGLAPWPAAVAEGGRPPLAIASCGNAALAAATLAAAAAWPIKVFVPPSANENVVARLTGLAAEIVVCPRRAGDLPGDPCVHRFRDAVAAGAVPFSVQGTENAWCLDGGRTIGWEVLYQAESESDAAGEWGESATGRSGHPLDRVIVQVGGGAFAASVGAALRDAGPGGRPILHTVQTEGCAPLSRAWKRAADAAGRRSAAARWSSLMWPWETEPYSAADGILDDETYDWLGVFEGMLATGGSPIVAPESDVIAAAGLAAEHTSIAASATGTAGLAGLLTIRDQIGPNERVAVIFSGLQR